MNTESGPQNKSPREIYFDTIKRTVEEFQKKGELPDAYVAGLLDRVGRVEGPFEDEADAFEKAQSFIEVILPIVKFVRMLNGMEIQFLAVSGEIVAAKEKISKLDIPQADKDRSIVGLLKMEAALNTFLNEISNRRSAII